MKPRLVIRPAALGDLEEIAAWIERNSPAAAGRLLKHALADFERLAAKPTLGRLREFPNPRAANIRSWAIAGFPNHLVFYRPIEDGVEIIHVIHGARDLDAIFRRL